MPNVRAQQAQLSLADILIGLRSNKVTLVERNKLLAGAVDERGITFVLTPEIEKELENTGASPELIGSIRRKNVIVKVSQNVPPKVVAAPVSVPVEQDFAFFKKQADESLSKNEIAAALENYAKAIELNPKSPVIYLNRAIAHSKNKDYDAAISDFDTSIELNPDDISAYANRAALFEKIGKQDLAVLDFKKILELDDKNEIALNNLKRIEDEKARILQKQKDEEAAKALAEAEKLKPVEDPAPKVETKAEPEVVKTPPEFLDIGQITPSMAVQMAPPVYSQIAKNLSLSGQVIVEIMIDETGNVISAKSTDGHRLLRESAEQAAKRSKFNPATFDGKPIKSKGFIIYNFVR